MASRPPVRLEKDGEQFPMVIAVTGLEEVEEASVVVEIAAATKVAEVNVTRLEEVAMVLAK